MPEFREKARFPNTRGVRATAKALLVKLRDGREQWVPQSVIDDDSEVFKADHVGTLIVADWWAEKAGIWGLQ